MQDEPPPQFGKRYPIQVLDRSRAGRRRSPALSTPDSERINTLNEQSNDSSMLPNELSTPTHQYHTGLYSPPLDSGRVEQTREDVSQASIRKAQASNLRSIRDILRGKGGLDRPTFLNLHTPPLDSRNESLGWESLPELLNSPLLSVQPIFAHESSRKDMQPLYIQKLDPMHLQNQDRYDLSIQSKQFPASHIPPPENQNSHPREHHQRNFLRSPSPPGHVVTIPKSREEGLQGSVMPKIEGKEIQPEPGNPVSFLPDVFDQPVPDLSAKPATGPLSSQFDQGCSRYYTHSFYDQHDHSDDIHSNSQASCPSKRIKEEMQRPARRKTEAVIDNTDILEEQAVNPQAHLAIECLCGCGDDDMHDLQPSWLTSPNTFYEDSWALTKLEGAAKVGEQSEQIWRRNAFDGCPLDGEPLDSKPWTVNGDDRGNVLKTSLPPFGDDTYGLTTNSKTEVQKFRQRQRQRSTSTLNTSIRRTDDAADTPPKRSIPYVPDTTPLFEVPDNFPRYPSRVSRPTLTEKEFKLLRQKVSRKIEAARLRTNGRLGVYADQCSNVSGRSLPSTLDDMVNEAREKLGRSLLRAPTVRPKAKTAKSLTRYIPESFSPSEIPVLSKRRPIHHRRKGHTAEEDKELLLSGLRKLEAMRLERHLLYGMPFERGKALFGESPRSTSQGYHVEEMLSSIQVEKKKPTAEETHQLKQSLYQKMEPMKLRRNRGHGVAIYHCENAAVENSPSTSLVDRVASMSSTTMPTSII